MLGQQKDHAASSKNNPLMDDNSRLLNARYFLAYQYLRRAVDQDGEVVNGAGRSLERE